MAKHVLHTQPEDTDFILIGITSALNQYEMVSAINDRLDTDLALSDYVPLFHKEGVFNFSLFTFFDESLAIDYSLVPNQSNFELKEPEPAASQDLFSQVPVDQTTRLIKELPKVDFFLMIKGEVTTEQVHLVMERLKEEAEILAIQLIETAGLPSRKNLIF